VTSNTTAPATSGSWRLRIYPLALLIALLGSLLYATVAYDVDHPTSRLGGDYPAFYAAGEIAARGDWDELYSDARQQSEQAGLIDDEGGFLYFSYPPFVAAGYSLLTGIGYRWSFLIHTALMTLALIGAIKLLWPWLERAGWPLPAILALSLAFYPVLRAVPGGQNTTLSLLLLAAAVRWETDDKPVLAGLALALLMFKPQFGVVLLPLLLIARRWRVLAGWVGGAALLYLVSALLMGGVWVGEWWEQATGFSDLNTTANGRNFVSIPGFFENVAGVGEIGAIVAGFIVAAAFGAVVAYFWWTNPSTRALERYALAGAAVVLAAPQTLFYDAGLMLLAVLPIMPRLGPRFGQWLALGIALTWLQPLSATLGWSPLGPIVWVAAALILWQLLSAREPTHG
jgi:hypothetical protein